MAPLSLNQCLKFSPMHREVELVVDLVRNTTFTFATHRFGRNKDSAPV